jgi:hypothetical protein
VSAADRSPAGAVSAAEGMARLLGSEAVLDAGGRRWALGSVLAPEEGPALQERYEGALARLDLRTGWAQDVARGVPVLMRSAVFGARLPSYDGASATVELWIATVAGTARTGPVDEAWATTAVALRWSAGRWWLVSTSTTDGPAPTEGLTPPSPPAELYAWAATGAPHDRQP